MYISNIDNSNKKYYECGSLIGKYLINQGIPELSRIDNKFIFVKSKKLQKAIDVMPLYLRFLVKAGVVNG